jgi:glutamine amidotransferase PdxT
MIGVLALQGAFLEHLSKFAELGVAAKEVRRRART